MSLRPVCYKCRKEMDVLENEVFVIGEVHDMPRLGDLYGCAKCGNSVVTGFGNPILGLEDKSLGEKVLSIAEMFGGSHVVILDEEVKR